MHNEKHWKSRTHTPRIVLSCPHAQCDIADDRYEQHYCDWVAEDALKCMLQHLPKDNVIHILGKDEREEHDLNRGPSRNRPFRKLLAKSINEGDVHIDVHSYPDTYKKDDWYKYDMVIFVHNDNELTNNIISAVKDGGFSIKSEAGDSVNDICNQVDAMGASTCLLEFSSGLKDSGKLDDASKAVCSGIMKTYATRNATTRKPAAPAKMDKMPWDYFEELGWELYPSLEGATPEDIIAWQPPSLDPGNWRVRYWLIPGGECRADRTALAQANTTRSGLLEPYAEVFFDENGFGTDGVGPPLHHQLKQQLCWRSNRMSHNVFSYQDLGLSWAEVNEELIRIYNSTWEEKNNEVMGGRQRPWQTQEKYTGGVKWTKEEVEEYNGGGPISIRKNAATRKPAELAAEETYSVEIGNKQWEALLDWEYLGEWENLNGEPTAYRMGGITRRQLRSGTSAIGYGYHTPSRPKPFRLEVSLDGLRYLANGLSNNWPNPEEHSFLARRYDKTKTHRATAITAIKTEAKRMLIDNSLWDLETLINSKPIVKEWLIDDHGSTEDILHKKEHLVRRYVWLPEYEIVGWKQGFTGKMRIGAQEFGIVGRATNRSDAKQVALECMGEHTLVRANPTVKGEYVSDIAKISTIFEVIADKNALVIVEGAEWFANYGHYVDYINEADNMAWDIYAPGFNYTLAEGEHRIRGIHSILELANGNHKICVIIDSADYNSSLAFKQVSEFKDFYQNLNNMQMRVMFEEHYQLNT